MATPTMEGVVATPCGNISLTDCPSAVDPFLPPILKTFVTSAGIAVLRQSSSHVTAAINGRLSEKETVIHALAKNALK